MAIRARKFVHSQLAIKLNKLIENTNLILYKINESGEMSVPLDVTDLMSDDLSKSIPSAHLFEFQKVILVLSKIVDPEKSIPRLTIICL